MLYVVYEQEKKQQKIKNTSTNYIQRLIYIFDKDIYQI